MDSDIKLNGDTVTVEGRLLVSTATDVMLDNPERRGGKGGPFRRALVHAPKDVLAVNFDGDYTGGVDIGGLIQAHRDHQPSPGSLATSVTVNAALVRIGGSPIPVPGPDPEPEIVSVVAKQFVVGATTGFVGKVSVNGTMSVSGDVHMTGKTVVIGTSPIPGPEGEKPQPTPDFVTVAAKHVAVSGKSVSVNGEMTVAGDVHVTGKLVRMDHGVRVHGALLIKDPDPEMKTDAGLQPLLMDVAREIARLRKRIATLEGPKPPKVTKRADRSIRKNPVPAGPRR